MKNFFLKYHRFNALFLFVFSALSMSGGLLVGNPTIIGDPSVTSIVGIALCLVGFISAFALTNLYRTRAIDNKKVAKHYYELYQEGYSIDNPPDDAYGDDIDGDGRGDDTLRRMGIIN